MPDITQRFLLDAADTLRSLDRLNAGFSRLNQTLASLNTSGFNSAATQVNNNLNAITGSVTRATSQVAGSLESTTQAGVRSAQQLTVSWETMARIVTTQFIVRGLSQLRDAFRESTQEAILFQRAISQVQTIAGGATFQELANQVRQVSDNFNLPVVETARGLYQTLSNQVGDTATSFEFFATAAKFAAATNSSTADSVDLLSGVLKSFNIDASQTGTVAAQLFRTIDLGRISAESLANTFGRIGPIAANIGVSFEELQAALATLTINGLSTSEAITQINGVLTALQKPSEAGAAAIRNLGFESAQQAISTLGFAGTLQALASATDGSAEAFSELVPRVRGLNAFIALGSRQTETFAQNLGAISGVNVDFLNEKFELVAQTAGFKVTEALNKLKNTLTVDLGQGFLEAASKAIEFTDGVVDLSTLGKAATPVIEAAGAALLIYAGRAGFAAAANLGLTASLSPLTAGLLAVGAIAGTARLFDQLRETANQQPLRDLEARQKAELAQIINGEAQRVKADEQANQQIVQGRFRLLREISATYIQDLNNARTANESYVQDTTQTLERILNARRSLVKTLAEEEQSAFQQIEQSRQRVANLTQNAGDQRFEFRISGLSDAQKTIALQQQAQAVAAQAATQLSKANTDQQVNQALAQFQRAKAFADQARQVAQSTGNPQQQAIALRAVEKIIQQQVEAEGKLQTLQADRQGKLNVEQESQRKISAELEKQAKIVAENTGLLDKQGKEFNPAEQADRLKKQQAALQEIVKASLTPDQTKSLTDLGLGDVLNKLKQDISKAPLQLPVQIADGAASIRAQVQRAFNDPIVVKLSTQLGVDLRGQTIQQIQEAILEAEKNRQKLSQADAATNVAKANVDQIRTQIDTLLKQFDAANNALNRSSTNKVSEQGSLAVGVLQSARAQLQVLLDSGDITQQKLQGILSQLKPVAEATGAIFSQFPLLKDSVEQLSIATLKLDGLSKAEANLEAAASQAALLKEELLAAAEAAQQIAIGGGEARFNGGTLLHFRYLAAGGRGLDRVPAMLDPREFVVNARSAQRFASQLSAINAGVNPVFRQNGGPTFNVGDINIQESSSPRQTAREVVQALRREQRRGSSRL